MGDVTLHEIKDAPHTMTETVEERPLKSARLRTRQSEKLDAGAMPGTGFDAQQAQLGTSLHDNRFISDVMTMLNNDFT